MTHPKVNPRLTRDTIIMDLDGVLCDDTHRHHFRATAEWDEYHSQCFLDRPFVNMEFLLHQLGKGFKVIVVTGRNEKWRNMTVQWLKDNQLLPFIDDLYMRGNDDYRKTPEIKVAYVEDHFRPLLAEERFTMDLPEYVISRVIAAFDDSEPVVEAYLNYGIEAVYVPRRIA